MDRSKKLLNNSLILLVGTILTRGLNFIMAPLFTRWLEQSDYGMFDLLSTYSMLLIPVLAVGIHHAIFRFILDDSSEEGIAKINTNAVVVNIIGIVIYLIFVTILSIFYGDITSYIIQLTILLFAQTFQNYMSMFARGLKKIKVYTIMNITCTASILLFVFIFVKTANMGLNGIILGYSAGYFLAGLLGFFATRNFKYIKLKAINKSKQKEMLGYSIHMVPYSIAWWLVNISDRIIVNIVLGPISNAILAVSHKIPNLCITLYDVFQTAWMENASEAINDKDWEAYFSKMFNTMGQICISISMIIITTNFFLYDILFTKEYVTGKYLVPMFAFAVIFNALSQTIGSVFIAEYNSKEQGITMIEAGVINIIIHLLLIKHIGIYASAVSTVVAYSFLFVIRYIKMREKYKIHINKQTIILAAFLVLFMVLSYVNIIIIDILALIVSIIVCFVLNKQTIFTILNKLKSKVRGNVTNES